MNSENDAVPHDEVPQGAAPHDEVNAICDAFEEAWQSGNPPDVSLFLLRAEAANQQELVQHLVEIDHEYRLRHALKTGIEIYGGLSAPLLKLAKQALEEFDTTQPGSSHAGSTKSRRIGAYKLLQQIGEGGMGTVWMAEQQEPVVRRVALKVIRGDLDSKETIARFEAERQALAMMDHPNIAKVLDAGTTEHGNPFFVMELVRGIPLTQYCDDHRLSIRKRLELMIPVCNAIQHAHQKGIIHRDLKPNNVLVTIQDGKPVPKVIDFGLAKALDHTTKLTDKTMFTEFGKVVGTLQYMSPEQAEMSAMDVDTRTDVYSLGAMLYEMLTGSTPITIGPDSSGAFWKILQSIKDNEPPTPSQRLSKTDQSSVSSVSALRQVEPVRLQNLLKGDLDWIVMKSLEKDRTRRYDTASALAADLEKYLGDEPVEARPPSRRYLLQKFVRRNRGLVSSLTAIGVILLVSSIVLCWLAINNYHMSNLANENAAKERDARNQANEERKRAIDNQDEAFQALKRANLAQQQAETEREIADEVRKFQSRILRQADIYFQANQGGRKMPTKSLTVLQALEFATEEYTPENIELKFSRPEVQSEILETIAETYSALDEHEVAIKYMRAANKIRRKQNEGGLPSPELLVGQVNEFFVLLNAVEFVKAADAYSRLLDNILRCLDEDVTDGIANPSEAVDTRIDAVFSAIERRLDPRQFVLPEFNMSDVSDWEKTRVTLTLGRTIPLVDELYEKLRARYSDQDMRTMLARLMVGFKKHAMAEAQGKTPVEAIADYEMAHDYLNDSYDRLAIQINDEVELAQAQVDMAIKIAGIKVVLGIAYDESYGPQHPAVVSYYESSYRDLQRLLVPQHPGLLMIEDQVATAYAARQRVQPSLAVVRKSFAKRQEMLLDVDWDLMHAYFQLGRAHYLHATWDLCSDDAAAERLETAEKVMQEGLKRFRDRWGDDDFDTAKCAHELARIYIDRGDFAQAETYARLAWIYQKQWIREDTETYLMTLSMLGLALEKTDQVEEAIATYEALVEQRRKKTRKKHHPLLRLDRINLARLYELNQQPEKAKELWALVDVESDDDSPLESIVIELAEQATRRQLLAHEQLRIHGWEPFEIDVIDEWSTGEASDAGQVQLLTRYKKSAEGNTFRVFGSQSLTHFEEAEQLATTSSWKLNFSRPYELAGEQLVASIWSKPLLDYSSSSISSSSRDE